MNVTKVPKVPVPFFIKPAPNPSAIKCQILLNKNFKLTKVGKSLLT